MEFLILPSENSKKKKNISSLKFKMERKLIIRCCNHSCEESLIKDLVDVRELTLKVFQQITTHVGHRVNVYYGPTNIHYAKEE
jgi:hypothetical protein